ncbi:MAG: hypothetical protein EOP24_30215 [Hyphomicrobiales bacterium]|nr:MAG: hypothetical protein EOP24_30215 [Hyphomicrobiales bacterium]
MRIHSLPESKRYPDDDCERAEIVRRHLEIAQALLAGQELCILFLTWFGPVHGSHPESISGFEVAKLTHLADLSIFEDDDEVHFFATPFPWNEEEIKKLVLATADGLIGPILFANMESGTAYAPYDGGADLFFPSHLQADIARKRWASWLSERPDGL